MALKHDDLRQLALAWIQGADIPWRKLRKGATTCRISLPLQEFAKVRHWIPERNPTSSPQPPAREGSHPLIRDISLSDSQVIAMDYLDPESFYFADHVVAGQPLLPAAAIVEILRARAAQALGKPIVSLSNLCWLLPVSPQSTAKTLQLRIEEASARPRGLDLVLESVQQSGRSVKYSGGEASAIVVDASTASQSLDLRAIELRCSKTFDISKVYSRLKQAGLDYGPSFRGLKKLSASSTESLATLELPEVRRSDSSAIALHPSLLDAAFQSAVGLVEQRQDLDPLVLLVPYRISRVHIHAALPSRCRSHMRLCGEPSQKEGWTVDIDISDTDGNVLVQVQEMNFRPMRLAPPIERAVESPPASLHYWTTEKRKTSLSLSRAPMAGSCLLLTSDPDLRERMRHLAPELRITWAKPHFRYECLGQDVYGIRQSEFEDYQQLLHDIDDSHLPNLVIDALVPPAASNYRENDVASTEASLQTGLHSVFSLTRAMVSHPARLTGKLLVITQNHDLGRVPAHAAISGLLKSAVRENSQLDARLIEFSNSPIDVERILTELCHDTRADQEVQHTVSERLSRQIRPWVQRVPSGPSRLTQNGTYWITGGLGGIGKIVSLYLAKEFKARLLLTGRRSPSADSAAHVSEVQRLGGDALYLKADVDSLVALQMAVAEAKKHFGDLQGVFHSAGSVRDGFLVNKTDEDIATVLTPKTRGIVNVDLVSANEPLKFFAGVSLHLWCCW